MKRILTTLAAVALVLAGTATATAKMVFHERSDIATYALVESTWDLVYLEGSVQYIFAATEDENDGMHIKGHYNYSRLRGEVVDNYEGDPWPSPNVGAQYRANAAENESWNMKKGETETKVSHFNLIGQGGAPDVKVTIVWHVTVNANGEVTAVVDRYRATEG